MASQKLPEESIKNRYFNLFPAFKQEKTQRFTVLVLTLIAFSLFGFFAINPTVSTIAKLKKELLDNEFINQKLEEKIKNLSILNQKYSLLNDDLTRILSAIPQVPSPTILMGQIHAVAANNNVTIASLQTSEVELPKNMSSEPAAAQPVKLNDYSYFGFSLGVEGSYKNLLNFMSELTDFDRIIEIESISITKSPAKTNSLIFDLKGKAYFKQ